MKHPVCIYSFIFLFVNLKFDFSSNSRIENFGGSGSILSNSVASINHGLFEMNEPKHNRSILGDFMYILQIKLNNHSRK